MTRLSAGPRPWRTELRETFALAWPLALANLLQMLTYAIDVVFIARLGEAQLAASSLAVSLFGLVMWGLMGLTTACAPLIAEELGARAPALRPVRRATRMALWLCVIVGVVGMGVCAALVPIMQATGQEPAIIALADSYMTVLLWSLVPMLFAQVLRAYVSALGRPIFATAITGAGIGVNALANYAFVFGNLGAPALGLQGAAIATIITSLVVLATYVIAIRLDPRLHRYHVFGFVWRPDWQRLKQIVAIGTPIMFTIFAEAGIFGAAAFLMGRIDATQLAAHTIALQIAALAFQVPYGVGQAATIRVGYFYGARDPGGMGRAGWTGIGMAAAFMATTALAMVFVPEYLIAIYLDPWDPANAALVAFAIPFLTIAAAFQLVDGVQAVAAGALRGLQDTRVPMWIAIFAYWVPGFGLAAGLGLRTDLEGVGVWIGLATGLLIAAFLLGWRWHRRERLGLVRKGVV
ncbi:MATE family efflux transporter [Altererythrobacter halimionae]|uniref:Multidrug-efflux transporter n=2 Tax=Alteriqipengyuania halimionae TaxID=1926630 RepID=A0A6I4U541_9SPHN|nr:MATE family efflux transporter [Alteriqipengyuania halimionae]MXP11098.1 MATE family efflux transporter [Alteriqipengyuania halimionae]